MVGDAIDQSCDGIDGADVDQMDMRVLSAVALIATTVLQPPMSVQLIRLVIL